MELATLQTWLPLVIALVALFVSAFFNFSAHSDRKLTARLAREKDLHDWAKQLSEVYVDLVSAEDKGRSLAKLSVLIDYGRLFFPNEMTADAKRYYAKGRRSSILDPLIVSHKRCSLGDFSSLKLFG